MRFGWLTLAASPSPEQDQAAIGQQIELACTVEALGFDSLWLTEHYFTGESVYNDALTFAAALAMNELYATAKDCAAASVVVGGSSTRRWRRLSLPCMRAPVGLMPPTGPPSDPLPSPSLPRALPLRLVV